jgi:hypothetical protein
MYLFPYVGIEMVNIDVVFVHLTAVSLKVLYQPKMSTPLADTFLPQISTNAIFREKQRHHALGLDILFISHFLPSSLLTQVYQTLPTQQSATPTQACTGNLNLSRITICAACRGTPMKFAVRGDVARTSAREVEKTAHDARPPRKVRNQNQGTSRK